jgi:predicted deacylase
MINARGYFKDAGWIAQQCEDIISDLHRASESTLVCGFIMDSASANRKAYEELLDATKGMTCAMTIVRKVWGPWCSCSVRHTRCLF